MADGERAGQGLFTNALVNDCFLRVRHGVRLSRSINLTWQEKRLCYIPLFSTCTTKMVGRSVRLTPSRASRRKAAALSAGFLTERGRTRRSRWRRLTTCAPEPGK